MKSKLLLLLSILILSGCAMFRPKVVIQTQLAYNKVNCPNYPSPSGISMLSISPRAIFDINGIAWVGLTPKDYERSAINYQEFIRFIKAQKGQTKYYRDCILDYNVEIERLQGLEKSNDG